MLKVFWVGRKVEDSRCLNLTCVAADKTDECHQVPRVENRVAGQMKDGSGMGCLYSQQAEQGQKREGTHKSGEPVAKTNVNS